MINSLDDKVSLSLSVVPIAVRMRCLSQPETMAVGFGPVAELPRRRLGSGGIRSVEIESKVPPSPNLSHIFSLRETRWFDSPRLSNRPWICFWHQTDVPRQCDCLQCCHCRSWGDRPFVPLWLLVCLRCLCGYPYMALEALPASCQADGRWQFAVALLDKMRRRDDESVKSVKSVKTASWRGRTSYIQ